MAKEPRYKQLGLRKHPTKAHSYIDKNGKEVSDRQYRKMKGKPGKGSPGHKQRMKAKQSAVELKKARAWAKKNPGKDKNWYKTGQEPIFNQRITEEHNKQADELAKAAFKWRVELGLIDKDTAEKTRKFTLPRERKLRRELQALTDRIETEPMQKKDKEKLIKKREQLRARYNTLRSMLRERGIVLPKGYGGEGRFEGWYH